MDEVNKTETPKGRAETKRQKREQSPRAPCRVCCRSAGQLRLWRRHRRPLTRRWKHLQSVHQCSNERSIRRRSFSRRSRMCSRLCTMKLVSNFAHHQTMTKLRYRRQGARRWTRSLMTLAIKQEIDWCDKAVTFNSQPPSSNRSMLKKGISMGSDLFCLTRSRLAWNVEEAVPNLARGRGLGNADTGLQARAAEHRGMC